MSDQVDLRNLAARVAGLREGMEAVMNGSTSDTAKWEGVNSFVRTYSDLANQYSALTGDKTVNKYDMRWSHFIGQFGSEVKVYSVF